MQIRASHSLIAGGLVAGSVWVNALWMQEGRHPAPLFSSVPVATSAIAPPQKQPPALITPDAAPLPAQLQAGTLKASEQASVASSVPPAASSGKPLEASRLAMLQSALFEMGFYDGPVDGIDGPRTHFAIVTYQKAHGLEATAIADDSLLAHARKANGGGVAVARPEPLTAEQRRVRAVQLVLVKLGYMRTPMTGNMDDGTRAAIIRFQRDRGLPVTGEMSGPLLRELSAASGVPIEERAG